MANHPVSPAKLAVARAARESGASWAEAAEAGGIGEKTLRRYMSEGPSVGQEGGKAASLAPGRAQVSPATQNAVAPPPSAVLEALESGAEDESLLAMARDELRNARRARKQATADELGGVEAKWSERIEKLIAAVMRLQPPPPPPPDLVERRLRELDAKAIMILEQHLPDPISPREAWG